MIGLIVPGGADGVCSVLSHNGDKNYLTPLEIAALLDNHLVAADLIQAAELMESFGLVIASPEARLALSLGVALAAHSRNIDIKEHQK